MTSHETLQVLNKARFEFTGLTWRVTLAVRHKLPLEAPQLSDVDGPVEGQRGVNSWREGSCLFVGNIPNIHTDILTYRQTLLGKRGLFVPLIFGLHCTCVFSYLSKPLKCIHTDILTNRHT